MNVIEKAKALADELAVDAKCMETTDSRRDLAIARKLSRSHDSIQDLLSIVERLPVTADGVPITLGMKVWYIEPDYEQDVVETTVTALYPKMFEQYRGDCCVGVGGDWEGGNLECHSTRAAAEAAKEGE